ncbi:transcriptional regulator, HxlR family [Filimonas lacunae]|uniref:Transcriptional regulator, HxlR family n=1 Tax=Filimonas lacunae TaxID=477680 RepID=A0A1N7QLV8_9BACT|nr:helix-turn-helix domain-containing protein [Filimonas lacunae]SIT23799.1 transcriptional regulator, HxlR family [Filimonas lacunae]
MTTIKDSSSNQHNQRIIVTKCPVTFTLFKMGGRWKPLVFYQLTGGIKRYGELKRAIPAISEKMLFQTLKELEADGIIIRTVIENKPQHVEYSLSVSGNDLRPVFIAMVEWATKYNI